MKRILSLVLAAIMLTALTPALAENVTISYKEATIDFTMPTGYPLFEKINSSGDTHFLMMVPMDYGSGQTRVGIAEDTAEGWVEDKVEFFQNMLETDQNATYEDPQISGPTVWTLDNGLQAQVAFASVIYETAMTKAFGRKKIQYNYYAAIPLYSDLILTADFSQYTNADDEQLLNDECVMAVLNNLVITVPEQQATSVEAQAQTAAASSKQGVSNVQDELIEANMQDGLVLEDCRFVLAGNSDSYWDANLYLAIRNDSNETITPKGSLQMLDVAGNVIEEDNYPSCYPSELAPGEVGYVIEWNYLSKDKLSSSEDLAKISVSFGANEYSLNANYTKLDITGEMLHDVDYFDSVLRCTITNNESEMVKGPWVVAAIYDQNDRLAFAYMTMVSGGNTCYLPASQQFVLDIPVASTLEDWYKENGIELSTVKLLCYSQN
ncbi:MAG: hypothetical protein MRZ54_07510 [Clostridiales bacterium]|nr:hypothetical protein [Clostridiales bacterium]